LIAASISWGNSIGCIRARSYSHTRILITRGA
jgi:hypothetical protein